MFPTMVFAAFSSSLSVWIVIFCFCIMADSINCKSIASSMQDLKKELLKNYDKSVRPSANRTNPTSVDMRFDVQHIVELDEKQQILTIKGHLTLFWQDDRMKWKPEDYEQIKAVRFKKTEIWIPDIVLLYSLGENEVGSKESTVLVTYTGILKWYPGMVLKAPCSSKLRHFPFDDHNCTLQFGSWTHGSSIDLRILTIPVNSMKLSSASGWIVQNVSQELFVVDQFFRYTMIYVNIFLKRASRIYRYVCVVPTVLTVVATLAGFWLQAAEPARYVLGCSNFIIMALLLQHLVTTVPAGKDIPIIAEYAASCLCMACVFVLVTVVVNIVSRRSTPAPPQLVRFARNVLSRWLCLTTFVQPAFSKKQRIATIGDSHPDRMAYFDEQLSLAGDWLMLSLVIDRIAFWVFTLVFVVLIGVLISV